MTANNLSNWLLMLLLPILLLIDQCCGQEAVFGNETSLVPNNKFFGSHISIKKAPYIVTLMVGVSRRCTGTIIAIDWVITAAQCFDFALQPVIIYAGIDIIKEKYLSAQVRFSVNVQTHPYYDRNEVIFDIALVQVQPNFELSKKVGILPIAPESWPRDNGKLNRSCEVFSWGVRESLEEEIIGELHSTSIKFGHGADACGCLPMHKKKKSICSVADEGGYKGVCKGDIGGPLVCDGQLYGVESYGARITDCETNRRDSPEKLCLAADEFDIFMYLCPELNWIRWYTHTTPRRPAVTTGCGFLSRSLSSGAQGTTAFHHMEHFAALFILSGFLY